MATSPPASLHRRHAGQAERHGLVVFAHHRLDQRLVARPREFVRRQADVGPQLDQRRRVGDVAILAEVGGEQPGVHAVERLGSERGRGLRDQVRRHAVRRRPGVALPRPERRRVGLRRRPGPAPRVELELVERPGRAGCGRSR